MFRYVLLPLVLVMASVLSAPAAAQAQAAWSEGFEGPQPSWRMLGGDAPCQLLQQQRVQDQAHSGRGCEWLQVSAGNGTYVYVSHDVGRPRVIDELLPSVWIRSDHAGLQLAADIVLPRVIDPRTGKPQFARVFGPIYTDAGRWQQLRIEGIPRLLAQQVRVLRTQWGPSVDGREAYIERVVLNVYGGPGVTNVWIDDLAVNGYARVGTIAPTSLPRPAPVFPVSNSPFASSTPPSTPRLPLETPTRMGAQLNGSVLSAGWPALLSPRDRISRRAAAALEEAGLQRRLAARASAAGAARGSAGVGSLGDLSAAARRRVRSFASRAGPFGRIRPRVPAGAGLGLGQRSDGRAACRRVALGWAGSAPPTPGSIAP